MNSNKEDFFKTLSEIKPIDLFDENTTKTEALAFYAEIMKSFAKYSGSELRLSYEEAQKMSQILVEKGCVRLENFKELLAKRPDYFSSGKVTMGDLIKEPKDIGFPLSAAGNAINNPDFTISYCFGKGEWCDEWYKNYKDSLEEIETV